MFFVFSVVLKPKSESYINTILYFKLIRHIQRYKKILDTQSVWVIYTYYNQPPKTETEKNKANKGIFFPFLPIFWRFSRAYHQPSTPNPLNPSPNRLTFSNVKGTRHSLLPPQPNPKEKTNNPHKTKLKY